MRDKQKPTEAFRTFDQVASYCSRPMGVKIVFDHPITLFLDTGEAIVVFSESSEFAAVISRRSPTELLGWQIVNLDSEHYRIAAGQPFNGIGIFQNGFYLTGIFGAGASPIFVNNIDKFLIEAANSINIKENC